MIMRYCTTCEAVFLFVYLFMYLFMASLCGMRDLSSTTSNQTHAPRQWKRGVLVTGPPESGLELVVSIILQTLGQPLRKVKKEIQLIC